MKTDCSAPPHVEEFRKTRTRFNVERYAGAANRRGLTLIEVLLSLGLFLGAVTVLSQLWWNGVRASVQSQLRTQAILRCESKMNEVVAGAEPLLQVTDTPF